MARWLWRRRSWGVVRGDPVAGFDFAEFGLCFFLAFADVALAFGAAGGEAAAGGYLVALGTMPGMVKSLPWRSSRFSQRRGTQARRPRV